MTARLELKLERVPSDEAMIGIMLIRTEGCIVFALWWLAFGITWKDE